MCKKYKNTKKKYKLKNIYTFTEYYKTTQQHKKLKQKQATEDFPTLPLLSKITNV